MKVKTVRCDINGCGEVADMAPTTFDQIPPGWGMVEIYVAESGDSIQVADLCPQHAAEEKGAIANKATLRRKIV